MEGIHAYALCPENEQVFQNRRFWRVVMKRKQICFCFFFSFLVHKTFYITLFSGSKFSGEPSRSSSAPAPVNGWWLCLQIASECPNRMQAGLQSWEQIFSVPVPYLTPIQGLPLTCDGKTSPHLHFPLNSLTPGNPAQKEREVFHGGKFWASTTSHRLNECSKSIQTWFSGFQSKEYGLHLLFIVFFVQEWTHFITGGEESFYLSCNTSRHYCHLFENLELPSHKNF